MYIKELTILRKKVRNHWLILSHISKMFVLLVYIPQSNTATRISNLVPRVFLFSVVREDERPWGRGCRDELIYIIKPQVFLRRGCFMVYNSKTLQISKYALTYHSHCSE